MPDWNALPPMPGRPARIQPGVCRAKTAHTSKEVYHPKARTRAEGEKARPYRPGEKSLFSFCFTPINIFAGFDTTVNPRLLAVDDPITADFLSGFEPAGCGDLACGLRRPAVLFGVLYERY